MSELAQFTSDETPSTGAVPTRLSGLIWALSMAIAAAGLVLLALNWSTPFSVRWGFRGFQLSYAIPTATVAALIAWGRPRNPIGWILLAGGLLGALAGFSEEYAVYTLLTRPGFLADGSLIAGLGHWLWLPAYGLLSIHVPLLFPDGRFLTPRWRVIAWLGAAWIVLGSLWLFIHPGPLENISFIDNPFGVEELNASLFWSPPPSVTALGPGVLLMAAAATSLVFRFRQSGKEVRQQLKWLAYAATLMPFIGIAGQFDGPVPNLLLFVFTTAFPVAVGIAILRHRLYDIDLLINRTLVYGALTACIVGLYALLVGSAGMVLQTNSKLAGLLLTGVLAVAVFRPVRGFVQRGVDRVMDGKRPRSPKIPPPAPGETARARLSGGRLRAARVGWVILGVAALGILLTSLPGYALKFSGQLGHVPSENPTTSVRFFATAGGLASLASAALSLGLSWTLFRRKFDEPAAAALSYYLLVYGIVLAGPLESWGARWVGNADFVITLQGALLATPTVALFALFPNGRFVPAWMRWALILSVPWNISLFFLPPFTAANITRQPFAYSLVAIWFASIILLGVYAQIYRYRRASTAEERQQTKWVVFGFALWMGYIFVGTGPYYYMTGLPPGAPLPWWVPASQLGWWLSLSIVPVSLTIAVTRHRLWNIDLVINRTLVYGALTLSVVALYVLVIGSLGLLFQSDNGLLIPLLATGLAAVLFQPLRERLQGSVNRLMYGERDDPYAVLSRLGARLEEALAPAAVLPAIAETVAHALKLPYAAIELRRGDAFELAASFGPLTSDVVTYPISYQAETVGRLLCAPRSPHETFSAADEQLLRTIAGQAGAAVHAVQLTDALQRSRERLVTAREEERRRIRRDLHDGLGPALAVQALKQETALEALDDDPDAARQLLRELYEHTHSLLTDVRRLVYDLRPPALDELGLVSAVREQAVQLVHGSTGLRVVVDAPTDLPELPAAVETAAYRIAVEAIANAARHARADRCVVRIEMAGDGRALCVEVEDDGWGLAKDARVGVGLTSMRERAAELGGTCEVRTATNGGTQVRARLPLPREA